MYKRPESIRTPEFTDKDVLYLFEGLNGNINQLLTLRVITTGIIHNIADQQALLQELRTRYDQLKSKPDQVDAAK